MALEKTGNSLRNDDIPVQLRAARFPRAGYIATFGALALQGVGGESAADSLAVGARAPSVRLTLSLRYRWRLSWQLSALRLAPYNTTVRAGMGGLSYTLNVNRLLVRPFVEVGLGRVEARFDCGGYYALPANSTSAGAKPAYVPRWCIEQQDGMGAAGGLDLEFIVIPHLNVALSVGAWHFGLTPNTPVFPGVFAGGGLRWSR